MITRPTSTHRVVACLAAIVLSGATATSAAGAASGWSAHLHNRPATSPATVASRAAQLQRLAPGERIGYAVNKRTCATTVRPGHVNCFAMRRVAVKKGTPGAYPYLKNVGVGLGPAGGYTPADLAVAFNYDPTLARSSQTVGIVDWFDDPHIAADLAVFDTEYGLPAETATSFRKVNQHGAKSPLPSSSKGKASAGEIALDVETVRGVCNTCKILLVESTDAADSNIAAAENTAVRLGATEVTNSFGEPEAGGSPPASVRNAYNHPGVVITASTGDDGWYGWDFANNNNGTSQNSADFPSTDPTVIAVGGTATYLNNDATIAEETVWNENGPEDEYGLGDGTAYGAGGGGCSAQYNAPPWQAAYPGYAAAGCSGKRLAADVSSLADPQTGFDTYDSWGNGSSGWGTIGGTSLASPIVAAMFALAGGSGGAAYPAFSLYENAANQPSDVLDVTSGGNSFCGGASPSACGFDFNTVFGTHNPNAEGAGEVDCSFPRDTSDPPSPPPLSSECNAVVGYDGPSGVGTPNGTGLFASTSPKVSLKAPSRPRLHKPAAFSATAHELLPGAHITKYAFAWGDGRKSSGSSAKASHTYTKKGTFTVTLVVTDSQGQQSVASKTITIGKALKLKVFGPKSVKHGHRAGFTALASDPNTGGKIKGVHWSWGDHKSSKGTKASHVWKRAGTYSILITITDTTGVRTTYKVKQKVK